MKLSVVARQHFRRCVMNLEARGVPDDPTDFLRNCLVGGDPEQQHGANKVRRRAILLSVAVQAIAIAALIIFPLLGRGEHIPIKMIVEPPPFRLGQAHPESGPSKPVEHPSMQPCLFCKTPDKPGKPTVRGPRDANSTSEQPPTFGYELLGTPDGVINGLEPPAHAPRPPINETAHVQDTRRVTIGHIDPAFLVRRVEPIYPPLCVQLRRETRVELHAIIGTDGTIQSLQVLSGDPLFYQSALDAVREWHYHPTILNGHAVEVDTHITVIYSLNR